MENGPPEVAIPALKKELREVDAEIKDKKAEKEDLEAEENRLTVEADKHLKKYYIDENHPIDKRQAAVFQPQVEKALVARRQVKEKLKAKNDELAQVAARKNGLEQKIAAKKAQQTSPRADLDATEAKLADVDKRIEKLEAEKAAAVAGHQSVFSNNPKSKLTFDEARALKEKSESLDKDLKLAKDEREQLLKKRDGQIKALPEREELHQAELKLDAANEEEARLHGRLKTTKEKIDKADAEFKHAVDNLENDVNKLKARAQDKQIKAQVKVQSAAVWREGFQAIGGFISGMLKFFAANEKLAADNKNAQVKYGDQVLGIDQSKTAGVGEYYTNSNEGIKSTLQIYGDVENRSAQVVGGIGKNFS